MFAEIEDVSSFVKSIIFNGKLLDYKNSLCNKIEIQKGAFRDDALMSMNLF